MHLPPILAERYQLVRAIGKGRSFVYEAIDLRLSNRRCAIKIFDLNQDSREKIQHEIGILATHALKLFFIPDIYDTGSDGSQAYIVMEYIAGETLRAPWEPIHVEQFVRTLLQYLIQMHAVGIIHRDIKPQNIISTNKAERPYVLIDFGIAKHGTETLSDARVQLSTDYAAPEQFTATTDARSDLFSLGATAYTLLVGNPPPDAMKRLVNDTLLAPSQAVPNVSQALDVVIMEMLQLKPENRPLNATAALKLLDELSSPTVGNEYQATQPDPMHAVAVVAVEDDHQDNQVRSMRTAVDRSVVPPSTNRVFVRLVRRYWWLALMLVGLVLLSFILIDFMSTSLSAISICKAASRKELGGFEFLRDQGVVVYNHTSTGGAVLNDKVRVVKVYQNGLLIGYHATADNPANGFSYLSDRTMLDCNTPEGTSGQNVNTIAVDQADRVWVGSENGGLVLFDRSTIEHYSENDVLPSNEIFGLTAQANRVWIATRNGVATVENGETWDTPYQAQQNLSIAFDDVHAIAVTDSGWIWIGHISNGISLLRKGQSWQHYPTANQEFVGVKIRDILVLQKDGQEQVWIATADGGIVLYQNDTWTTYDITNGLPSNEVQDIAVDPYQRVWFATSKGVVFFDGDTWFTYNHLPTYSIDFGSAANPACRECRFDDDSVWTGTEGYGLTYSRLPYPDQAINVDRVCFWLPEQSQVCPPLTQAGAAVTATYTTTLLQPGDKLNFLIEVVPQGGYELSKTRGDMLINADPGNVALFGVHENIGVTSNVAPGEPYTFFHPDKPLVATDLDACQRDGDTFVCSSSWRLWTHTRHAGPSIKLVFRVSAPPSIPPSPTP